MTYDPQVDDIVYLCPEADVSRFTYYQKYYNVTKTTLLRYEKALSILIEGNPGIVMTVSPLFRCDTETRERFANSKHYVFVSVCTNKEKGTRESIYLPEWMLSLKPHVPCMVRLATPDTTRMM